MPNNENDIVDTNLGTGGEIFCKQDIEGVEVECFLEVHADGFSQEDMELFYVFCRKSPQYIRKAYTFLEEKHNSILSHVYEALFAIDPDAMEEQFPGAGHYLEVTPAMTLRKLSPKSITLRKGEAAPLVIISLEANPPEPAILLAACYTLDGNLIDMKVDY